MIHHSVDWLYNPSELFLVCAGSAYMSSDDEEKTKNEHKKLYGNNGKGKGDLFGNPIHI